MREYEFVIRVKVKDSIRDLRGTPIPIPEENLTGFVDEWGKHLHRTATHWVGVDSAEVTGRRLGSFDLDD